jgi:hypothetical protein
MGSLEEGESALRFDDGLVSQVKLGDLDVDSCSRDPSSLLL